jgi:hypothetical protein
MSNYKAPWLNSFKRKPIFHYLSSRHLVADNSKKQRIFLWTMQNDMKRIQKKNEKKYISRAPDKDNKKKKVRTSSLPIELDGSSSSRLVSNQHSAGKNISRKSPAVCVDQ